MTTEELRLIEITAELYNGFISLPVYHHCDKTDIVYHIHAIQAIIMQREAVRTHPEMFSNVESEIKQVKS